MQKMMIEAAINELASKNHNPNVPYGPEEIAKDALACIEAGATIVHFHARGRGPPARSSGPTRLSTARRWP